MSTLDEKKDHVPELHEKSSASDIQEKALDDFHHTAAFDENLAHDLNAVGSDIEEAIQYSKGMSAEEVHEAIVTMVEEHGSDPNFPRHVLQNAKRYLFDEELKNDPAERQRIYEELKVEAALILVNSAYAEVRAVVDNHDDPSMPSSTVRAWVIGLIYVAVGAFINQFFSIRQPGITIYSNVAQLLAFPAGKLFEYILPHTTWSVLGVPIDLNPGPFNLKEHMVITIMANVGFSAPYTNYVVWVQYVPRFFNQPWVTNFGYQILVALSTNYIGYGLAGLTRRFLVYPAHAIWPTNLATIALNRAFHAGVNPVANGWKVSRMRWFLYCFGGMFVYFWFPNYLFQALSYFNWTTWIDPQNVLLYSITGTIGGLGLNPLPTFDWNQITVQGDPLINPFFTTVNMFFGTLLTLPIIAAMWYTNVWYTGHLPINSNGVFDNTGKRYNVSRTVDANTLFNTESFRAYSPAYLSAANILLYGIFFAAYSSTISHALLYHRHEMAHGFRTLWRRKRVSESYSDIHSRLMASYEEVPEWHYLIILVLSIGLGAAGVGAYPTFTTPAVVLYGVALAIIFCLPIGIIKAITNIEITLNVLAEFFGGLWFPGNATAMNYFKSYGYVTTAHTLAFAQDLKLAHYVHLPPKVTFWAQIIATAVSTFVCTGILNFQMTQIEDVCSPTQKARFTCPGVNTFFTASVLWGTLGPARMFGAGAIYNGLVWCFLIGFALPFVFYFGKKKFPWMASFHLPVFFYGGLIWAPYNLSNSWPAVPVAWFFNYYLKKKFLPWWSKYNYITTSAFSCAIALSAIVMFFALQWKNIEVLWVGNNRPFEGCDGSASSGRAPECMLYQLPESGHFGPGVGEFL